MIEHLEGGRESHSRHSNQKEASMSSSLCNKGELLASSPRTRKDTYSVV